jgi:histidyl-tRNA synthetase
VRGLDYYSGPVFEVTSTKLGAQDAIAAGGRYDGLVKSCGGPDVGGIGFALGIERLLQVLGEGLKKHDEEKIIYLAHSENEISKAACLKLYSDLLKDKFTVFVDMAKGSIKSQLRQANKINAALVLIVGDEELEQGVIAVKNMKTGEQQSVKMADVETVVKKLL